MPGRYIVLEGGEGVGKTTQARVLRQRLATFGVKAIGFMEPGQTPIGYQVRDLLLNRSTEVNDKAEVLLFNAARAQGISIVRQKLMENVWVIADRCYLSTLAMQGYGRGLDIAELETICRYATDGVEPDLIMVLSCSLEVLLERRGSRGVKDHFERLSNDFHSRVNAGYAQLARDYSLPVIDADSSVESVHECIWQNVRPIAEKFLVRPEGV
ncbi:MAG TPA: dTMP kinase [Candidatus Saccharimonadales bacterium]|nr:dTMP kinase [Candidatus Saccharimonadales bacterium]